MFAKTCPFDSVGLGSQGKFQTLSANSEFLYNTGSEFACDSPLALKVEQHKRSVGRHLS